MLTLKEDLGLCAICGKRKAVTKDHIFLLKGFGLGLDQTTSLQCLLAESVMAEHQISMRNLGLI